MQGNAGAQSDYALCLINGDGVSQDIVRGLDWLNKAVDQEDATALYNAGVFLYNGDIVDQDIDLAFEYFLAASEQDEPNALKVLDRWDELV